jgi:hypothetical protein
MLRSGASATDACGTETLNPGCTGCSPKTTGGADANVGTDADERRTELNGGNDAGNAVGPLAESGCALAKVARCRNVDHCEGTV